VSAETDTVIAALDVDLDAEVVCTRIDCSAPAAWLGTINCPTPHAWFPICDSHRAAIDAEAAARLGACGMHGFRAPDPRVKWRRL